MPTCHLETHQGLTQSQNAHMSFRNTHGLTQGQNAHMSFRNTQGLTQGQNARMFFIWLFFMNWPIGLPIELPIVLPIDLPIVLLIVLPIVLSDLVLFDLVLSDPTKALHACLHCATSRPYMLSPWMQSLGRVGKQ